MNRDIAIPVHGFPGSHTISIGGPTAPYSVTSLIAGSTGDELFMYDTTGQPMTVTHNDGTSLAQYRTATPTGAGITVLAGGFVRL